MITKISRRKSDPENSIRFKDEDGKEWLATVEWREPTPIGEPGPDQLNMCVYVDSEEDDQPPLSESRALTNVELINPEFDPELLLSRMINRILERREIIGTNENKIEVLRKKLIDDRQLKL